MVRIQSCHRSQAVFFAFALGGCLVVTPRAFANPAGAPDIPSATTAPRPRSVDEQLKLATDYFVGRGVAQDLKLAAYWYESAAESGDPEAEMEIGYLYDAGIGVSRDPVRAVHWYQLAAAGGLVRAKVDLAVAYLMGEGVRQNGQTAVQLLNEAATRGDGLAACFLGEMYDRGIGVARDEAASEHWFVRGAKLHDPQAEYNLGLLFSEANDHSHSLRAAESLLQESAAAGYVPAMHSLGLLLIQNPDLAKSSQEAIGYLNEAAAAGSWRSSVVLGIIARDGKGAPIDIDAAYYHFRVAALQGGDEAMELIAGDLRFFSSKLTTGQAQTIDVRAREWYQEHHVALEFVHKGRENRTRFPDFALAVPENGTHSVPFLPTLPN